MHKSEFFVSVKEEQESTEQKFIRFLMNFAITELVISDQSSILLGDRNYRDYSDVTIALFYATYLCR